MGLLKSLHAREVLDSRGNPTIEVVAKTASTEASAIVPSGASTGTHEALELRDNDKGRFHGKGVLKAVANVNGFINKKLRGMNVAHQRAIDGALIALDGTPSKSKLGANAILGVSLASAKAAAQEKKMPLFQIFSRNACTLPTPMMNVLNGGVHANSGLEFQEIMIVPIGAPTFKEALRMGVEVFHTLQTLLKQKGFATTVGDEGGFAPKIGSHEAALDLLLHAIEEAGYKTKRDIAIALDVAASEFFARGKYRCTISGKKKTIDSEGMVNYLKMLAERYPIISIEDGCAEDDWSGWRLLTDRLGSKIQIVGDDLFVTNPKRLQRGIDDSIANAILIKLNQIGTVTETVDVIQQAQKAGYAQIVSHRSGETEDTTIAHLAVGMETGQIKTGSLSRTDRVAKYNELLRIEEFLGVRARYARPFSPST